MDKKIKFGVAVEFVTPAFRGKEHTKDEHKWEVTYFDEISNERRTEIFDGVAVCTGRHGGGGFTPDFEGLENYKGFTTHSSKYKYPAKYNFGVKPTLFASFQVFLFFSIVLNIFISSVISEPSSIS